MIEQLGGYLAALRALHKGYGTTTREGNATVFGAYGMLLENWQEWSSEAGLGGADWRDPEAQDAVAGYWATKLYSRYGNWDLVSAAWYGGQNQADMLFEQNRTKYKLKRMSDWQDAVNMAMEQMQGAPVPRAARNLVARAVPKGTWLHPVAGASKYSNSFMPNTVNHRGRTHPAIDVYADKGTPIVAPANGTVVAAGTGKLGGHYVRIRDEQGLEYYFAHMDAPSHLRPGQQIGAGQHIGLVGNSGSAKSTSPHLHFSIKKGAAYVNPYGFLEGSKNANGFFEASAQPKVTEPKPSDMLDRMLERVSNTMAGEDRLDPRTIGVKPAQEQVPL